ncbi:MAG: hypothetical protein CME06_06645 [Gemmatimonadetes bacterium]|nr:hypothetical protein [Gemmatimonadota bacterium]
MLTVAATSFGSVIYVPSDQPTIQAGIDLAVDGDTVMVRPGTYVEGIDFKGKAIVVESDEGPDSTVIDGGWPGTSNINEDPQWTGCDSVDEFGVCTVLMHSDRTVSVSFEFG